MCVIGICLHPRFSWSACIIAMLKIEMDNIHNKLQWGTASFGKVGAFLDKRHLHLCASKDYQDLANWHMCCCCNVVTFWQTICSFLTASWNIIDHSLSSYLSLITLLYRVVITTLSGNGCSSQIPSHSLFIHLHAMLSVTDMPCLLIQHVSMIGMVGGLWALFGLTGWKLVINPFNIGIQIGNYK